MADANKFVRIDTEAHKLMVSLTKAVNKKKVYPSRVYNDVTVKMALVEFAKNHSELGVK